MIQVFRIISFALMAWCLNGLGTTQAALKSTKVPRFDTAVAKSVSFLQANAKQISERDKVLVAYALMKAGVSENSPIITEALELAKGRGEARRYEGYDHIYLAGVDSMLLADSENAEAHVAALQGIADYVQSVQRSDGSWSDGPQMPGDVSMSQYGVLALWSAQRTNCQVSAQAIDNAAGWFSRGTNGDGGWGYRPGTTKGPGGGNSTHNMTVAGAGSVAVARTLLHGPKGLKGDEQKKTMKFGVLEKVELSGTEEAKNGSAFPGYSPKNGVSQLDGVVNRGLNWNQARFQPVSRAEHKIYFYYALERASALADLPEGWFTTYGDGLLKLQAADGSFNTHSGPNVGTSFAILYFMRSTQQIINKQYAGGVMSGARGLDSLYGQKKKKKELQGLDVLLAQMEKDAENLDKLDDLDAAEIVESVQFGSKEDLIGQVDKLKLLLKSNNPENRRAAYFALGRTGDYSFIPEMMKGLRDKNVDVNVEALQALRYIARKPNGFGLSLQPLAGAETADDATKVEVANKWRTKAFTTWMTWYRDVRPYDESGGLDELQALTPKR